MEELGEKVAQPIRCDVLCIHYTECYPYVNPVGCTRLELWDDIKQSIKQAGYVKLSDDQSLPHIPYIGLAREKYNEAQQDMLKSGFRRVEL